MDIRFVILFILVCTMCMIDCTLKVSTLFIDLGDNLVYCEVFTLVFSFTYCRCSFKMLKLYNCMHK